MAFIWIGFGGLGNKTKTNSTFGNIKEAKNVQSGRENNQTNEKVTKFKTMDDNRTHIKDIKHQGENKNMTTIKKQF